MHAHVEIVRDRDVLARHFRRAPALHAYALGDLDPFFWPHTSWLADSAAAPKAIVLNYAPPGSPPSIHALTDRESAAAHIQRFAPLLAALVPELPDCFEMHLSPAVFALLETHALLTPLRERWRIARQEEHAKLQLPASVSDEQLAGIAIDDDPESSIQIQALTAQALRAHAPQELSAFYDRVYPGHWFDPRMLGTEMYLAAHEKTREGDLLCAAAGVHVFSREYAVAALGNIAVAPTHRRQGLARQLTARLCERLRRAGVNNITLNVRGDNTAAIDLYRSIGVVHIAKYVELAFEPAAPV